MIKTKVFLSFLMLALFASNAAALGSEELLVKALNAKQAGAAVDYNDGTLMNIEYTGVETTAVVYLSSGMLTINAPIATSVISSISLNATAYDTLGELCDYINTVDDIVCKLTGGKRNDASVLLYNTAALLTAGLDIHDPAGYSILIGTGAVVADDTNAQISRIGITPSVSTKRILLKGCRVGNDGAGTFLVYGKLAIREGDTSQTWDDTVLVYSEYTADDTAETVPDVAVENGWLLFAKGAHVVISAGNSTTTQSSDATTRLACYWEER